MNHPRTNALIGSAVAAIAAVMTLPGGAWATGTTTLSAQTAYNCEVNTPPPPPEDYSGSVTANIQFTAPSSVYPGETINLSGTLTLQFPENLRAAAIAYGDNSVQGVSTTINVGVDAAGQSTDVFADEWQTPPTEIGNPMQVSGVLTMPPLTVPRNATGFYELQMPENGATANTAESSPAKVAFTATATATGSNGQTPIKLACYLPGSSPELGQIPVVAAPAATTQTSVTTTSAGKSSATSAVSGSQSAGTKQSSGAKPTASRTKAAGTTQTASTTPAAKPTASTTKAAGTPQAASTTQASGTSQATGSGAAGAATGTAGVSAGSASAGASGTEVTSAPAGGLSAAVGTTGTTTPEASSAVTPADGAVDEIGSPVSSSIPTRSGVYVSTSLLVLGGFLVCIASLAYALLTRYRLNSIRRSLEG